MKQFDLFSKDIILIPINHSNSHWTAAAINFRRKRIESYDSMGMDRNNVYKVCLFVLSFVAVYWTSEVAAPVPRRGASEQAKTAFRFHRLGRPYFGGLSFSSFNPCYELTRHHRIHLNKKICMTAVSSLAISLMPYPGAWNISTFLKMTWLICGSEWSGKSGTPSFVAINTNL